MELEKIAGNDDVPAPADIKFLEDGADGDPVTAEDFDGRVDAGRRTGLNAFNEPRYEDIAIIYAPDAFNTMGDALADKLMSHCENNKYRFAILDAKAGRPDISLVDPRSSRPSLYAAFYYPWIRILDADTGWLRKLVPPGGHVAGIYARSDGERGVYKAPANEVCPWGPGTGIRGYTKGNRRFSILRVSMLSALLLVEGGGSGVLGRFPRIHSGNTSMFGVSLSSWKLPSSEGPRVRV